MTYLTVSIAYTGANLLLALIIYFKSYKQQTSWYYFFCVLCLVCFGIGAYLLSLPIGAQSRNIIEQATLFIYSLYPFLFIHFITYFARRKEIIKSLGSSTAIYFVGLLSYSLMLMGYIPKPLLPDGTISQTGYIFYLTWMSIFFSIGIAMLFEISRQFRQTVKKANVVFISSLFLLLILPGPFTDSIIFGALKLNTEWYFYLCTFALIIAVYFIFRHKIIVTTMYDALKSALEVMNDIFVTMDENFNVEMIRGNAVKTLLGYQEKDLIGKPFIQFIEQAYYLEEYKKYVRQRKMRESYFDADVICKDGNKVPINFSFTPMFEEDEVSGYVSVGRDMTERKKLESQLRQSQKMESLGTLAGGIAHDFNNLLQIMLLNTASLKRKPLDETRLERVIDVNTTAIRRGSKLVQQILTFARKTDVEFKLVNLNTIIEDLNKMLFETFPRTITLQTELDPSLPQIFGDPNQLNQVLLNLCVNARDAMKSNGTISIQSEVVFGLEVKKSFSDAGDDRYVCITVTDTGSGMDKNVLNRIFEPFFTTKDQGKGTGLGLAVVYGIVTSHKGFIDVKSTVGLGTMFTIYFPLLHDGQKVSEKRSDSAEEISRGSETILFVEDEEVIIQSISTLLQNSGYKVVVAMDGYDAVDKFKKNQSDISLIVMDIGLPKLSGWEVCQEIRAIDKNIKIILASGYLDPKLKSERCVGNISEFLLKPYEPDKILQSIRRVIDAKSVLE